MSNPTPTPEELHKDSLARMLESGDFSDLKITCGPYHFDCHKAVICPQSEFFRLACKQDSFKEGYTGIINLASIGSGGDDASCDFPQYVKIMIEHFYGRDFGLENQPNDPDRGSSWLVLGDCFLEGLVRLFVVGAKYQVPLLQAMAAEKFAAELKLLASWESPLAFEAVVHAVNLIYGDIMPAPILTLRKILAAFLWTNAEFRNSEAMEECLADYHELCHDLIKANKIDGSYLSCADVKALAVKNGVTGNVKVAQDAKGRALCDGCQKPMLCGAAGAVFHDCSRCNKTVYWCVECKASRTRAMRDMCRGCSGRYGVW